MGRIDVTLRADITAVLGSTGSGKSWYVKSELARRKPARLVVWDPEGEYSDMAPGAVVSSMAQARERLAAKGRMVLVFEPSPDPATARRQFDLLCRMLFEAGPLLFVAEELADVTEPSRAPVGWSMLTRRGRKRGISIIGVSQRPASIDKTFLGGCSTVRSGRLLHEADARVVGAVLGVHHAMIMGAKPLEFWQRSPPDEAAHGVMGVRQRRGNVGG